MRAAALVGLLALFLLTAASCAPHYLHPAYSPQRFARDTATCRMQLGHTSYPVVGLSGADTLFSAAMRGQYFDDCMASLGWEKQ